MAISCCGGWGKRVGDGVIAVGVEAGDLGDGVDTAASAAALDED